MKVQLIARNNWLFIEVHAKAVKCCPLAGLVPPSIPTFASLHKGLRAHLSFTRRLLVTSTTQKCELITGASPTPFYQGEPPRKNKSIGGGPVLPTASELVQYAGRHMPNCPLLSLLNHLPTLWRYLGIMRVLGRRWSLLAATPSHPFAASCTR